MQLRINHVLHGILLTISSAVFADTTVTPENYPYNYSANTLNSIKEYLQYLGQNLGYDITQNLNNFQSTLINPNGTYATELNLYTSYLGSLLGGGSESSAANFNPLVPTSAGQGASTINALGGKSYSSIPYNTPSTQNVSVSELIDQSWSKTYQDDPVSQGILNILSTPDYTYCTVSGPGGRTAINPNCQYLFREQIMAQIIGQLQLPAVAFSTTANQQYVAQLNSDTLLMPLLYSLDSSTNNNNSTTQNGTNDQQTGLTAQNQAQAAANFIRYVSSAVTPLSLPSYNTYTNLISVATNGTGQVSVDDQQKAQATLYNYLTRLRTYAAQISVGLGNLYSMLSRRLPQPSISGSGPASSEALDEYIMASWRLFAPPNSQQQAKNPQWLTTINNASPATVQKETAILLAEINYQLYLSRQLQERMLLTQSILLMQQTQASQPDSTLIRKSVATGAVNDTTGNSSQ